MATSWICLDSYLGGCSAFQSITNLNYCVNHSPRHYAHTPYLYSLSLSNKPKLSSGLSLNILQKAFNAISKVLEEENAKGAAFEKQQDQLCECSHELRSHIAQQWRFDPDILVSTEICGECECDYFVLPQIDTSYTNEEQEKETMARLTSELQDAGVSSVIPNGLYVAFVEEVQDTDKNDVSKPLKSQAGAPMCQLDWTVAEGDYTGKKVRFDTLMLGGMSKDGKPISLSNLCNFLHRTGTPWTCEDCHNPEIARRFYIAEGNDDDKAKGLKKGNFYCPDCKTSGVNSPRISYDTANFKGARCKIGVGSKTNESGREFNIVKGYTDI